MKRFLERRSRHYQEIWNLQLSESKRLHSGTNLSELWKTKMNLTRDGNLHNNESADRECTSMTPARVSFSAVPLDVPPVGSCKRSLNRPPGLNRRPVRTCWHRHPPQRAVLSVLMSVSRTGRKARGTTCQRFGSDWHFLRLHSGCHACFLCTLSTSGRAVTALPRRARQGLSLWRLPSRQVSDWTLACLPKGGSAVALRYEKGSVCFPKSTSFSQKKSLATNLRACLQKKNLVLPVL